MKWKSKNLRALADIICGNVETGDFACFKYRSSSYLTEFFEDCDLDFVHDGSTRWAWVSSRLEEVLAMPRPGPTVPPDAFIRIIRAVLDRSEAQEGDPDRVKALASLNEVLVREGGRHSTTSTLLGSFATLLQTQSHKWRTRIAQ